MDVPYRLEKFQFNENAAAGDLSSDEDRFIRLFEASRNNSGLEGDHLEDEVINRILDSLLETQSFIVIDEDDEIAAVVAYEITDDRLWLEGVATDRFERSRGIGGFVINKLIEIAKENRCSKVSGYSQPNSRTVGFYRQHKGYVDESIRLADDEYTPMTIDVDLA